jgi:4-diphosphocytidyl-2-C-methyl-D-erythritol kinase
MAECYRLWRDQARAKVNLTLNVRGKCADGYHELESVVLFADLGDIITFSPKAPTEQAQDEKDTVSLEVTGPFAAACKEFSENNLIHFAAKAFNATLEKPFSGHFQLTKNLPIAAGIGGGSADAAAAFRLLCAEQIQTQPENLSTHCLSELIPMAKKIGADVPVCLFSRAAFMTGIGEQLQPLDAIEPIPAVLVNPLSPLSTGAVFRELSASPLDASSAADLPVLQTTAEVLAYACTHNNDLEKSACRLLPVINDILEMLNALPGTAIARLSGSGPTCFALFHDQTSAEFAAEKIREEHPDWWSHAVWLS